MSPSRTCDVAIASALMSLLALAQVVTHRRMREGTSHVQSELYQLTIYQSSTRCAQRQVPESETKCNEKGTINVNTCLLQGHMLHFEAIHNNRVGSMRLLPGGGAEGGAACATIDPCTKAVGGAGAVAVLVPNKAGVAAAATGAPDAAADAMLEDRGAVEGAVAVGSGVLTATGNSDVPGALPAELVMAGVLDGTLDGN